MPLKRLVLLLALVAAASCRLLQPPGPTAVAQGRYFSTGNPNYDEFFVRLYRMQVELAAAPETLAAIRRDVARGLELPPTADDAALKQKLEVKATEMRGRGTPLAIERGRESSARPRLSVTGTPAPADGPLVKLLDDALARLGELHARSEPWQKELEWLPPNGIALDGSVEAAFIKESRARRDEVRENLADAQKVVALMTERAKEIDRDGGALQGVFTSALGETKNEPAPAPSAAPPPKARPRPAPPRPAAEAPAKPAPPSRPAAGDGEPPPAPKPKQGTARPDFEP